jgi:hypothetical protein
MMQRHGFAHANKPSATITIEERVEITAATANGAQVLGLNNFKDSRVGGTPAPALRLNFSPGTPFAGASAAEGPLPATTSSAREAPQDARHAARAAPPVRHSRSAAQRHRWARRGLCEPPWTH